MSESTAHPPKPTGHDPKLRFGATQGIGLAVFAVIVVLALSGVFGTTDGLVRRDAGMTSIEIRYPTRFRYKVIEPIRIVVKNNGEVPIPVKVILETEYLGNFSNIRFSPEPAVITAEHHIVDLGIMEAKETRVVGIEVQAERYGSFESEVELRAGAESVRAPISTISFP